MARTCLDYSACFPFIRVQFRTQRPPHPRRIPAAWATTSEPPRRPGTPPPPHAGQTLGADAARRHDHRSCRAARVGAASYYPSFRREVARTCARQAACTRPASGAWVAYIREVSAALAASWISGSVNGVTTPDIAEAHARMALGSCSRRWATTETRNRWWVSGLWILIFTRGP